LRLLTNVWLHLWGTLTHKFWVCWEIQKVVLELEWRALLHDWTKLDPDERKGFFEVIHLLRGSTYGDPGYLKNLAHIAPSINSHYSKNSHHPEFYECGIDAMDVYDLIEMACDWKAAVRRHANGDIRRSFEINQKRFGISPQQMRLLRRI
jgi:hypothetical protein